MKKFLLAIFLCLLLAGCGFSPRMQNRYDNKNGKIDEIRENQNGIMLEIGKLRQNAEIQNSQLKEVQQGMLNLNATGIRNENKGVQILQGDGALILIFALGTIGMLLFHFKKKADKSEQIAKIMAEEVMGMNDAKLNDNILRAAMHTNVETEVYRMMASARR